MFFIENIPPLLVGEKILRVTVGEETLYKFTVEDPDGDNFTVSAVERQLANTSLKIILIKMEISPTYLLYMSQLQSIPLLSFL